MKLMAVAAGATAPNSGLNESLQMLAVVIQDVEKMASAAEGENPAATAHEKVHCVVS